jgi:hypothetical protein
VEFSYLQFAAAVLAADGKNVCWLLWAEATLRKVELWQERMGDGKRSGEGGWWE